MRGLADQRVAEDVGRHRRRRAARPAGRRRRACPAVRAARPRRARSAARAARCRSGARSPPRPARPRARPGRGPAAPSGSRRASPGRRPRSRPRPSATSVRVISSTNSGTPSACAVIWSTSAGSSAWSVALRTSSRASSRPSRSSASTCARARDVGLRRARRGDEQQRHVVRRVEQPADQLARRRVRPVQVLDDQQQRRPARLGVDPRRERVERHRAPALRAQRLGLAAGRGQVRAGRANSSTRSGPSASWPASARSTARRRSPASPVSAQCSRSASTSGCSGLAPPYWRHCRCSGCRSAAKRWTRWWISRDLPIPGSPVSRTAARAPARARSAAAPSSAALGLAVDQRDQARGALGLEARDVARAARRRGRARSAPRRP